MATNDDLMFEYLLGMGATQPEQTELKRKQAFVDALRQNAMAAPQGQMVSGHYVAPGLAGLLGQIGTAYMAKQGQSQVDEATRGLSEKQRLMLEMLRRKRQVEPVAPSQPTNPENYWE